MTTELVYGTMPTNAKPDNTAFVQTGFLCQYDITEQKRTDDS